MEARQVRMPPELKNNVTLRSQRPHSSFLDNPALGNHEGNNVNCEVVLRRGKPGAQRSRVRSLIETESKLLGGTRLLPINEYLDVASSEEPSKPGKLRREPTHDEEEENPKIQEGTNWESIAYDTQKFSCEEEVTAIDVSEDYIAVQFHVDEDIHVFSTATKSMLFKLKGHEFGGECIKLSKNILYSGSMDKTVRSWDLQKEGRNIETIYNHVDYVNCLGLLPNQWVASGGRGDKTIFVYETNETGKLWKRFQFDGHEGWITQILFTDSFTMISGAKDGQIRIWNLQNGNLTRVVQQDGEVTCLSAIPDSGLICIGDKLGRLSLFELSSFTTIHLRPNIEVSTGCYCRAPKFHDTELDMCIVTQNNYVITASSGNKFIKIWKADLNLDRRRLEMTEIQILRDHLEDVTSISVLNNSLYFGTVEGNIFEIKFPMHCPMYEPAQEQEVSAAALISKKGSFSSQAHAFEICKGPKRCKFGKRVLQRSCSSFQVRFTLKPPKL